MRADQIAPACSTTSKHLYNLKRHHTLTDNHGKHLYIFTDDVAVVLDQTVHGFYKCLPRKARWEHVQIMQNWMWHMMPWHVTSAMVLAPRPARGDNRLAMLNLGVHLRVRTHRVDRPNTGTMQSRALGLLVSNVTNCIN